MADARRGKQKRKHRVKDEREKPSKEEYAVGKYLRFHSALNKDGKFLGNNSHYFSGSRAVDVLLESKWAAKSGKKDPLFTTRTVCEAYLERLLEKGFFFRVQKFEKRDKKKRVKENSEKKMIKDDALLSKKGEKKSTKTEKEELELDKKKEVDSKDVKEKDGKAEKIDKPKEESMSEERKRRKKRAKLEMHDLQVFIDGPELYVWMYDPVPPKTFIIGLLLVIGAIGVCLFPLWPPEVRLGVYYLSIAAACFVGVIISLCIVRVILFAVVWAVTFGRVCFWLLPNLTEDVGFFESFRPLYKYDVNSKTTDDLKTEGVDESEKNGENIDGESKEDQLKNQDIALDEIEIENLDENDCDQEIDEVKVGEEVDDCDESDSNQEDDKNGVAEENDEDEGRMSGSSSNDNGYEMIDAQEVESCVGLLNYERGVEDDDEVKEESVVRHRKLKKTLRKE